MEEKRHIRVVAALITDASGSRYLVQQRPAHKSRGSLWEFPGGKVEPGESDAAALVREGKEELGVELEVGELAWHASHEYPDIRVELRLHRARIVSGVAQPLDAQAIAYLSPPEMKARPFCEADLPLLQALLEKRL